MPPPLALFSIPAGAPFLPTLSRALLSSELIAGFPGAGGPLALARATIYVPTRRAAAALARALVAASGGAGLILPDIRPLGALEASEEGYFLDAANVLAPPAVDELTRRMALAAMTRAWARALREAIPADTAALVAGGPAQAFALAGDLAALIDDMIIEGVDWTRIDALAPENFDVYWSVTLEFLKIAFPNWPRWLAERGQIDASRRGALLIDDEIARLQTGARGPVIVAGSTGTNSATARLIAAIAAAPQGAAVLPDLDSGLDDESWAMIGAKDDGSLGLAGHPQAALSRLLATMGAGRADIKLLGEIAPALRARGAFLSEALRPAESTHFWRRRRGALGDDNIAAALADVALIEADSEAEEALALAIALRAALETPGKTVALITPDRAIARRVQAELTRWGVEVADSAGETLGATPAGALARLILASAESGEALDLAALLAHPLTRLSRPREALAAEARTLDLGVLRGILPAGALDDIGALIEHSREAAREPHAHEALKALGDDDWDGAEALLRDASAALAPLRALAPGAPLAQWVAALGEAVEAFARVAPRPSDNSEPPHPEAPFAQQKASKDARQEPLPPLSSFETAAAQPPQDVGERSGLHGHEAASIDALRELIEEWSAAAQGPFTLGLADFRSLFDAVAAQRRAPDAAREHPRLSILGLLEARLLSFDLALIAGLDEAIWPPQARTDAFLNRPMRAELGLSAPERRIGQTAHDFAAALGARQAILSRSKKRGDAPTVASRFVQRLRAVAGEAGFAGVVARGEAWLALARRLDQPAAMRPIKRPEPRPPVAMRPQSLSVTRIETLRRDPYAIYAERILKLKPLEPIGAVAGARETGTIWHEALRRFVEAFPAGALAPDAPSTLRAIARDCFAPMLADPGFAALAWPRIDSGLAAFLAFENENRDAIERILVEASGALVVLLADGSPFKLTAKADRIDLFRDGAARLVDYKTGAMPGVDEIKVGLAPQLTLEAAMLKRAAFREAPGVRESRALYLKLGGAKGGERRDLTMFKDIVFDDMVERHFAGMIALLDQFRDAQTPYLSRPAPKFARSFGAYDHLARVKEWSATGGLVEDGGEA